MISAYEYSPLINYNEKKSIQDVTMSFFTEKSGRKLKKNNPDDQESPKKKSERKVAEGKEGKNDAKRKWYDC